LAGRDITEGRGDSLGSSPTTDPSLGRSIAIDIGVVTSASIWQNTDVAYDVAIGGLPFIYAINDTRPYLRQTAPFKKDQFDNGAEPGEQSLTGWWIRSQSSFHHGGGIKFYDPSAGEIVAHRFKDSKGINIWTKGQATLLKNSTASPDYTTGPIPTNAKAPQYIRSIKWGTTNGILLHDGYDVDKIDSAGAVTHFIDYTAGTDYPVYAICDDGVYAYWITNVLNTGTPRLRVYKKPLTGSATDTSDVTLMFSDNSFTVTSATMEYVKDRIVMAVNNKIYEFATSASALPSPIYTHADTNIIYTSITASGPAIYISSYSGIQSSIFKFTLSTTGTMPTLTSAITAAEMPVGEMIHKIHYYLGYMMIGTSKGVRAANVSETDGSLSYGPIIVTTAQPCYDFATRDKYVWCATGTEAQDVSDYEEVGVIRIDLGSELETLRFAYANDIYYTGPIGFKTTGCAFVGETDRLSYCTAAADAFVVSNKALTTNVATLTTSTAHNYVIGDSIYVTGVDSTFNGQFTVVATPTTTTFTYAKTASNVTSTAVSPTGLVVATGDVYIEDSSTLLSSGYIETGAIRYSTLEPKNFKRLLARGNYDYGSMVLETVDANGVEYDHITYSADVDPVEVTTSSPGIAQEYVSYKFVLSRDATDTTKGPIFKGYQAKATIATPRQRVLKFPVYCFDVETDRYNTVIGYQGRALTRMQALEEAEQLGDVLTWQDLTTGESRQAIIEQVTFSRLTPPDKRFDGFGGVLEITIRTV